MERDVVLQRLGIAFVAVGVVLSVVLGDLDFHLVRGWFLGLVLIHLGLLSLSESFRSPQPKSRRARSRRGDSARSAGALARPSGREAAVRTGTWS
ncbi:hypothetical protein SsS58_02177 [Streptomyces scabiei]|uniref:Uncharacterized protein n=1 Tax=Streptomyces scabiei TaxID=1930 RepID=A0A117ED23_STRSC|nr:hypothetical protein SsS58_02177 [Streptomyces scabiei]